MEFLTPNRWSDDQAAKPVPMPALRGAAAFLLRFLDCLIYQPIRAELLHGAGVPVPSQERYTIHKLIVGSRRKENCVATAKSSKDRLQARSIIEAMIANRQHANLVSASRRPGIAAIIGEPRSALASRPTTTTSRIRSEPNLPRA